MKFRACAAFALLLATPVLADPPVDPVADADARDGTVATVDSRQDTDSSHDICVQIMERAFYLHDPSSFGRAIDASRELELARNAFHAGDEIACQRHAINALQART